MHATAPGPRQRAAPTCNSEGSSPPTEGRQLSDGALTPLPPTPGPRQRAAPACNSEGSSPPAEGNADGDCGAWCLVLMMTMAMLIVMVAMLMVMVVLGAHDVGDADGAGDCDGVDGLQISAVGNSSW